MREKLTLAIQRNVNASAEQIAGSLLAQRSDPLFNQALKAQAAAKRKLPRLDTSSMSRAMVLRRANRAASSSTFCADTVPSTVSASP